MSRIGKKPIVLPEKVKAVISDGILHVEGPQGKLTLIFPTEISADVDPKQIILKRLNEERIAKSKHGLFRALVANMVLGVSQGFKKELEINGVGYRAEIKGNELHMTLGFSHPVMYQLPSGVKATVEKQTRIILTSADKQLIGQAVAEIRDIKPPEPYKAKGIKKSDETVRRKAGKAAASSGGKK